MSEIETLFSAATKPKETKKSEAKAAAPKSEVITLVMVAYLAYILKFHCCDHVRHIVSELENQLLCFHMSAYPLIKCMLDNAYFVLLPFNFSITLHLHFKYHDSPN